MSKKTITVNGVSYDLELRKIESKNYDFVTNMSVEGYKKIISVPGFNWKLFDEKLKEEKISISLSFPPVDAKTKEDMRGIDIHELVDLVNTMAQYPKALIYMYANGYGFAWSFLTDLMEYLGCKNISERKSEPMYSVPDDIVTSSTTHGMKVIEIGRGWSGTKHKSNFYLDDETEQLFKAVLGKHSQQEQNKIISVMISEKLTELKSYQDNGRLRIKYKDIIGEDIT